jgi:hypothetical protein
MFKRKLIVTATLFAISGSAFAGITSVTAPTNSAQPVYNSSYQNLSYAYNSTNNGNNTLKETSVVSNFGLLTMDSTWKTLNLTIDNANSASVTNFFGILITTGAGGGNFKNQISSSSTNIQDINAFSDYTANYTPTSEEEILIMNLNSSSVFNIDGANALIARYLEMKAGELNFGVYDSTYNSNVPSLYGYNAQTKWTGDLQLDATAVPQIIAYNSVLNINLTDYLQNLSWYAYDNSKINLSNLNIPAAATLNLYNGDNTASTYSLTGSESGQKNNLTVNDYASNLTLKNVGGTFNLFGGQLNVNDASGTFNLNSGNVNFQNPFDNWDGSLPNVNNNGANFYPYIYNAKEGASYSPNYKNSSPPFLNNYTQTAGNLFLPFIYSGGNSTPSLYANSLNISGGSVYVTAEPEKYQAGKWLLVSNAASGISSYTYNPKNLYWIYTGSNPNNFSKYNPSIINHAGKLFVKLNTPKSTPAPSPAPTPAPAPSPAPTPAPKVHIVIPAREVQQINTAPTTANISLNRDISASLISTGITGGGPRGAWAKGLGGFSNYGQNSGTNMGTIFGYGHSFGPQKRDVIGIAGSYGSSQFGMNSASYASSNSYGIWLYDTFYPLKNRDWKFVQVIGGGVSSNNVNSQEIGLPVYSRFGGNFFSYQSRVSYWIKKDGLIISPRLTAGYEYDHSSAFKTNAAISALNANVSSVNSSQFNIDEAVLIGKKFKVNHVSLFPNLRLGVDENIGATPTAIVSANNVTSTISGQRYPHTQGMAEIRLDIKSKKVKGLSGNFSANELFGGGSSTEFVAAVKYRW